MEVPDSPRLTEQDRKSPIPNEIIDTGKAAVEAATGQPSTFTTTAEINGKREVVTGKVSDLVAREPGRDGGRHRTNHGRGFYPGNSCRRAASSPASKRGGDTRPHRTNRGSRHSCAFYWPPVAGSHTR